MAASDGRIIGRSLGDPDLTAVGLGALFAALILVSLWASAVAVAARDVSQWVLGSPSEFLVVSGLTSLGGLCLGALVYARHCGFRIALSLPHRDGWTAALGAVLAPAILTVGVAAVGNVAFDTTLSTMTGRWISPDVSVPAFFVTVGVPAVFFGVGYAFVFCGMVYERVRQLIAGEDEALIAALVVGFFWLLPIDAVEAGLRTGAVIEVLLSTLFGGGFAMAVGILYHAGPAVGPLDRRHLAVFLLAAVGVVGVATDLHTPEVAGELLWVLALGIALAGYGRTRSIWVSALSIAGFEFAMTGVVYVESLVGVAVP